MKEDIKQEWIQALNSGEYDQTTQVLHDKAGFCCLGVLTDLYAKKKDVEWKYSSKTQCFSLANNTSVAVLPYPISEWSGLHSPIGNLEEVKDRDHKPQSLSTLNDEGFTFSQISDLIKAFL